MGLLVEGLADDAEDIDRTKERLVLAAESRLRGARLYTAPLDKMVAHYSVGATAERSAVARYL